MNSTIKTILNDLYAIDPSLKTHEQKIVPIIQKFLAEKPHAQPDEAFVEKLRMMLREHATELSLSSSSASHGSLWGMMTHLITMNRYIPTIVGVALGVIITGPLVYTFTQPRDAAFTPTTDDVAEESTGLFSFNITPTSKRAFGSLSQAQGETANGVGGGGGLGGGGDIAATRPQSGGGGGGDPAMMDADGKMIMPYPYEWVQYDLAFDGELPELPGNTVQVLKRIKGINAQTAAGIISSLNLGSIDMSAFRSAKLDNISMYQDSKYGYYVNINMREGSVFLNQNWEQWPHPENNCQNEECYLRYRVQPNEIPSDEELIAIAQKFASEYKIDLSQYGEPEVDNSWRAEYARATDKSLVYVPESPRVIFPLMIDGKPVYEEGGHKSGISINVHAREKRVSDVWGIMSNNYESSGYEGVTDTAAILKAIDDYGTPQFEPADNSNSRTVTITLGTPTLAYVKTYVYTNTTNGELVVPALIFPVENVPDGEQFYSPSITIPLAKELFDQRTNNGGIMPLAY